MTELSLGTEWEQGYRGTRRNVAVRCERIRRFSLPTNGRVLDYGCGDGLDLKCLQNLGHKSVVGIDVSLDLLRLAPGSARVVADGEALPFGDRTFDAVLANSIIHHLTFDLAVAEISRVLRPGGALCIIDQRPGLPRRLLDLLTFSPLGAFFPLAVIRNRRKALGLEQTEYRRWLSGYATLQPRLVRHGFFVEKEWSTLLSTLLLCRKS